MPCLTLSPSAWPSVVRNPTLNLKSQYVTFLNNFLDGKIKPSTQVDIDVMLVFQGDLDNRADIDYREGHWDDDPNIVAGGKYFAKQAKKLMDHICNNVQISWS